MKKTIGKRRRKVLGRVRADKLARAGDALTSPGSDDANSNGSPEEKAKLEGNDAAKSPASGDAASSTDSSSGDSAKATDSTSSANSSTTPAKPRNDTDDEGRTRIPDVLPILPIRGTVVFPGTVMPLGVGRAASKKLLEESLPQSKVIALFTQRDEDVEDPTTQQLYEVGAAAMVLKLIRQQDDTVSIIVHGLQRVRLSDIKQTKPYFRAAVQRLDDKKSSGRAYDAAAKQLRAQAHDLIEITPNTPEQAQMVLMNIEDPGNLADFLAANLSLNLQQKQDLLEELDVAKRVRRVHEHVSAQLEIARLQQKIQQDVQSTISEGQRKYFLREQLKAIQKELGDGDDGTTQTVTELRKKLEAANPPQKVMAEAQRELGRLEAIPPASPEYSMILSYLELVAELPWNKASADQLDLKQARRILDRDHFGLEKVKRRLIEYLAVRKLNPKGRGPILCLLGPPGVGKTSLGQSIADALGRQFVRMSFGGIRDEAEIRGHRRTYIGAMPGRVIQEIRRAETNNPVMMLDEVDKLGHDFRGDPASALLEVLDPRQNNSFVDRYLDVPFDLSQVLFIATANYRDGIPQPLRDRMEIIDVPGYTDFDKMQIAKRYLLPRQLSENGLTAAKCNWQQPALRKVIDDYTREAGVRELERQIGAVCRGIAADVASGKIKSRTVTPAVVHELLGPEKFTRELDTRITEPGVIVGLAYTPYGGEVLFIEAAMYRGKGNITLTGQIGDVMKESASAALSLFKTRAADFNFDVKRMAELDLHIHVPAGAVPKDGPSAGVGMFSAIASLMLDLPLKQKIAMTGEITLRGLVLPIGGVKEKTLAASRAGIKTVILPEKNKADLEEIDPRVRRAVKFVFVSNVDELLEHALGKTRLHQAIKANGKAKTKSPAATA